MNDGCGGSGTGNWNTSVDENFASGSSMASGSGNAFFSGSTTGCGGTTGSSGDNDFSFSDGSPITDVFSDSYGDGGVGII